jgi:hypothetical protein
LLREFEDFMDNDEENLTSARKMLINEWNYEKNGFVVPEKISPRSKLKVWWKCEKGHEWKTTIYSRYVSNTGCPYCSGLYPIVGETDLATTNPRLVEEWDFDKNEIKPFEVKAGTGKKVWWKCENGHSWEATIVSRARLNAGCPYCSGYKAYKGETDLLTTNPELGEQWDYQKNDVSIYDVMSGSSKKAWWICEKGHSYEAVISSRAKLNSGCPYCAGQKAIQGENDLETLYPQMACEWDYEKNKIKPSEITAKSSRKVWWKCKRDHSYNAVVYSRTGDNKTGCPYCSGQRVLVGFNDLASVYPDVASEWDYEKNKDLIPEKITAHNSKMVWWRCPKNHEYQASIYNRVTGDNCPICSNRQCLTGYNDLETLFPEVAREWNYSKNEKLLPSSVVSGSSKKVWWLCTNCGYEWKAYIYNRTNGVGCPKCNERNKTSFPEQVIYYYIKQFYNDAINGYKDIFMDNKMELDIYIPLLRIGIEYDGLAWHASEENLSRECKKYEICKKNNIMLIRLKENHKHAATNSCDLVVYSDVKYNEATFIRIFDELLQYLKIAPDVNIERDRIRIKENYYTVLKEQSVGAMLPNLRDEWHPTKNGNLTPYMFKPGSSEKIWWLCKKCGNEWQAVINSRSNGARCPKCEINSRGEKITVSRLKRKTELENKVVIVENTIAKVAPELAEEWNYEKNGSRTPDNTPPQTGKKVWWKCKKGHEWEESVQYRYVENMKCPFCSGRWVIPGENDLITLYPHIAAEWDYDKNRDIDIRSIKIGSMKKVWWICHKCKYNWIAQVVSRTKQNTGCPHCNGRCSMPGVSDLKTLYPDLAAEWDYEKNSKYNIETISTGSSKKAWWKCVVCGYNWETQINLRTKMNTGCPCCSGRVVVSGINDINTLFPNVMRDWDYGKNTVDPRTEGKSSQKKVWWLCHKCGYSWQSAISCHVMHPDCKRCHTRRSNEA